MGQAVIKCVKEETGTNKHSVAHCFDTTTSNIGINTSATNVVDKARLLISL